MKKGKYGQISDSSNLSAEKLNKYFFWAIIAILIIISYLIIKPFIIALISAFILAYLIKPVHDKLSIKLNKKFSALVCVLIILILIIIPIIFVLYGLISQITFSSGIGFFADKMPSLLKIIDVINLKDKALSVLLSLVTSTISYLPALIISSLITLLGIYYILISWDKLALQLEHFLPFKDKKRIRKEVSDIAHKIIYGYVLIALMEFFVASVGFYLSGVKAYLLLASLIAIFAFIPGIGPGVVWVPTAIYYFATGNYLTAIGVLITGAIISILIETILLGKIVGKKSKIHPLIFLLGVLGGVPIFGIFGFIIGPLILVYAIKLIDEAVRHG